MSDVIRLTCEHCNHVIKAPRAAAGRRGKCPYCHNSLYVPTPPEELEEIPLADDDFDQDRLERLRREEMEVNAALLRDREEQPAAATSAPQPASQKQSREPGMSSADIGDTIADYVTAMRDSNLDKAGTLVDRLKDHRASASARAQQMMLDALPPQSLRDLPAPLYQGFLKKLIETLEN